VAVSKARREARAYEIAAAFARRAAPGFIAKGEGDPAFAAYLPAGRILADVEDRIDRNGKRIKRMTRALESMQPTEPAEPASGTRAWYRARPPPNRPP
jgi:hypothetical protein